MASIPGLFGGTGLFPDLTKDAPPTIMAQLALLALQDPDQFAQFAAAQGGPPADASGIVGRNPALGGVPSPLGPDLGSPLPDPRIDPTKPLPRAGGSTPPDNSQVVEILQALGAVEVPTAPTPRPFPRIPGAPSISGPRGGPDPQIIAQIIQLLQGQGLPSPPIPSLGQLIGG